MTRFFCIALCLLVVACSFERDGGFRRQYTLEQAELSGLKFRQSGSTMRIKLPVTTPELDTDRMAIQLEDKRQDYVAGAKWSDFLPVMAQSALVQSFAASGRYRDVVADDKAVRTSYMLASTIETFRIEKVRGGQLQAHIRMRFGLYHYGGSQPIRTLVVDERKAVASDRVSAMAEAFNALFSDVQRSVLNKMAK